jgi:hypothetical protein
MVETIHTDEPLNWTARIENKDGKDILVIDPISETIKHDDGSQHVIIKVPSLALIKEFKAAHSIQ